MQWYLNKYIQVGSGVVFYPRLRVKKPWNVRGMIEYQFMMFACREYLEFRVWGNSPSCSACNASRNPGEEVRTGSGCYFIVQQTFARSLIQKQQPYAIARADQYLNYDLNSFLKIPIPKLRDFLQILRDANLLGKMRKKSICSPTR